MNCATEGTLGWAVANTHVHKEALALEHLGRQNFTTYCPMISKRVRHARKYREVRRPLFAGYVFIKIDSNQSWRPLLSTIGVRTLIRNGDRPALLDNAFVQCLKAREIEGVVGQSKDAFSVGQKVRLTGGGYFEGLTGTILEMGHKDRVAVLLELLNGTVKAKVPVAQLEAAAAPALAG